MEGGRGELDGGWGRLRTFIIQCKENARSYNQSSILGKCLSVPDVPSNENGEADTLKGDAFRAAFLCLEGQEI